MSWGESLAGASSRQPLARVFAVVNQKGGVGKTTTTVNLAASVAASERATLLIDLDPQANASSAFGLSAPALQIYDVLSGSCSALEAVQATELSHLHAIPSGEDLSGAEIELVGAEERHARLRTALEPILGLYDYRSARPRHPRAKRRGTISFGVAYLLTNCVPGERLVSETSVRSISAPSSQT